MVQRALDGNHAAWGWATYAWSGSYRSPGAHIWQTSNGQTLGGVDCDFDESTKTLYGGWLIGQPDPGGDDMPLSTADLDAIEARIWQHVIVTGVNSGQALGQTRSYAQQGAANTPVAMVDALYARQLFTDSTYGDTSTAQAWSRTYSYAQRAAFAAEALQPQQVHNMANAMKAQLDQQAPENAVTAEQLATAIMAATVSDDQPTNAEVITG